MIIFEAHMFYIFSVQPRPSERLPKYLEIVNEKSDWLYGEASFFNRFSVNADRDSFSTGFELTPEKCCGGGNSVKTFL